MSTSNSIDEVMNEMNDWAKAEGRYLGKAFWEISFQTDSILDAPLTTESELRLAALRARRLERRKKVAEQSMAVAPQENAVRVCLGEKSMEAVNAEQSG
jgi:hypothetical protein